jgi:SOS-response transcriptional repressor LexA
MTDKDRATIRAWMRRVMQEHSWSAAEWARRADTSATNITRFLNGAAKHIPSSKTIAALARVAGYGPNYLDLSTQTMNASRALPLVSNPAQLQIVIDKRRKRELESLVSVLVSVNRVFDGTMFVVEITESSFDANGVMAGDNVVVLPEKEQPLEPNSKVVAMNEQGKAGVYMYNPPYLTTASTAGLGPLKLDSTDMKVIGTAIQVQREL